MGSKTTAKSRLKGTAYKCDLCGRKFMSLNSLKSHQRTVHNLQPKKPQPKPPLTKSKISPGVQKKATQEASLHDELSPGVNVSKLETVPFVDRAISTTKPSETKQAVEFECPKCFRRFLTYFHSLKHIQKFHCVNKQGVKVAPNSPFIIQPVRIELCPKCKKKVHSIATHICDSSLKTCLTDSIFYTCTACDQGFNTLRNFDSHVVWLHADDVESIFFPTTIEFTTWKDEMETQTKVKYTDVDKYESKFFYHCSYKTDQSTSGTSKHLCPSTLVVQEFTKGIQVHLYKKHYKHHFVDYNLSDKYKKYSINTYLKGSRIKQPPSNDDDVYAKFKTAMEKITADAAKVDKESVKVLFKKASDMIKILENIEQQNKESDSGNVSKNLSDSQITKALEDATDKVIKRKIDVELIVEEAPLIKRTRNNQTITNSADASSPKILNAFSLANNAIVLDEIDKENNIVIAKDTNSPNDSKGKLNDSRDANSATNNQKSTEKNTETNIQTNQKTPKILDQSLSSFNESYADFLVKNSYSNPGENKRTRGNKKKTITNNNNNMTNSADKVTNTTNPGKDINANPNKIVHEPQNITNPSKIILGSKRVASPSLIRRSVIEQNKKIADLSSVNKKVELIKSPSQNNNNILEHRKSTASPTQKKKSKIMATENKKNILERNKHITSPVQINKALLNQNKKNKTEKKKNVMKTKMGQFTKSTSPKKVIPKSKPQAKPKITSKPITIPRLSIEKPKVVVEYEVQEQEDDCNILILKI